MNNSHTNGRYAIEVSDLTRVYKGNKKKPDHTALDGFNLSIEAGSVHGLLGPNGAGKTTLCKILSTLLIPTSGTARVGGHDVVADAKKVRSLIAVVFGGEKGLYTAMTARQNLEFWASLYGSSYRKAKKNSNEVLDRVGLLDRANDTVDSFSRGMKQRLHLARGLLGTPQVMLLDEPTTGMDPVAAHDFRTLVTDLRDEGRTLLLTTHDMAEAESLCDNVSFIDEGQLLRTAEPRELGRMLSQFERIHAHGVTAQVLPDLKKTMESLDGVAKVTVPQEGDIIVETNADGATTQVLRALLDAGITDMSTAPPTLEEVYFHIIGDRGMQVRS